MRAGKLRTRLVIEHVTGESEPDAHMTTTAVWGTFTEPWGDVMGLAGSQIESGATVSAETTHRIEIRFRPNITPLMRIRADGQLFHITAIVDPDRRRQRLFLFCSSVAQ